jgi:hypothetical protein
MVSALRIRLAMDAFMSQFSFLCGLKTKRAARTARIERANILGLSARVNEALS